ncbi:HAD hydrolase-like protein [Rhizosaccharibacter radicis]|uniref:phosphoglycolate phosphatase n=1 Tax=Rhizosaccharibacter radicis TaxID=2782605 RepID=A0ABT1VWM5_9PROT|nr:HAD hydrolase-like protein [Acetobacteraceae bacterium KSS12]
MPASAPLAAPTASGETAPAAGKPLLVFDLDGTLVDTLNDITAAANRLLTSQKLAPITAAEVRPMIGDGVAVLVQRLLASRQQPPDAALERAYAADYAAHAAGTSALFDGMPELLERLRNDGWQLAVCTNKPAAATQRLLEALGISSLFGDAVGGGDSFPVRKPDPVHLLGTVSLAGGSPGRAVMLGDHRNDVDAAHGAGMPCIFAGWGFGSEEMAAGADAVAAHPRDVPDLARALLGTPRPLPTP